MASGAGSSKAKNRSMVGRVSLNLVRQIEGFIHANIDAIDMHAKSGCCLYTMAGATAEQTILYVQLFLSMLRREDVVTALQESIKTASANTGDDEEDEEKREQNQAMIDTLQEAVGYCTATPLQWYKHVTDLDTARVILNCINGVETVITAANKSDFKNVRTAVHFAKDKEEDVRGRKASKADARVHKKAHLPARRRAVKRTRAADDDGDGVDYDIDDVGVDLDINMGLYVHPAVEGAFGEPASLPSIGESVGSQIFTAYGFVLAQPGDINSIGEVFDNDAWVRPSHGFIGRRYTQHGDFQEYYDQHDEWRAPKVGDITYAYGPKQEFTGYAWKDVFDDNSDDDECDVMVAHHAVDYSE